MNASEDTSSIDRYARETGFSSAAVRAMADALATGGGGMAQFDHPEFGGSGQWMRGGMIMITGFGDHELKARIDRLCNLLARDPLVQRASLARGDQHQQQSSGSSAARDEGIWWPGDLGRPDSTGAQDDVRYAWFADARRLAVSTAAGVTVYDTEDHRLGGVSQQQGGIAGLAFSSQHGPIALDRLKVVSQPASRASESPNAPTSSPLPASAGPDAFAALERLSALHARGILDDDEYRTKKAELLSRI